MRNFILGCIVGAAGLYGSMSFHVIRAKDGYHFVRKTALSFQDTYTDIRDFDPIMWREHASLAEALVKADKSQLMQDSAIQAVENAFDQILHPTRPADAP